MDRVSREFGDEADDDDDLMSESDH